MIAKMKSFITQIRLLKAQVTNKCLLEEDEKILKLSFDLEDDEKSDNKEIASFDKNKDYELAKALENALLMSPLSDIEIAFHVQLPLNSQSQANKRDSKKDFLEISSEDSVETLQTPCEICS